jgi:hypothetical protein
MAVLIIALLFLPAVPTVCAVAAAVVDARVGGRVWGIHEPHFASQVHGHISALTNTGLHTGKQLG